MTKVCSSREKIDARRNSRFMLKFILKIRRVKREQILVHQT